MSRKPEAPPARRSAWWRFKRALLRTRPGLSIRVLFKGMPPPPKHPEPAETLDPQLQHPRVKRRQRPEGEPDEWPDPPEAPTVKGFVLDPWITKRGKTRFDIKLFEELNAEYSDKPLVPVPRGLDPSARMEGARNRLARVRDFVDLEGTRAIEIGCGQGQEVWLLRHKFGCDAYGIDIEQNRQWGAYAGPGVSYAVADAAAMPFPENFFDRAVSFAVWEHVPHPFKALGEAKRILQPGGIFWLYANLHRGASASHRYREVFFPWPHLLFDESVIDEFYDRRGISQKGYSWVNRLTFDTYAKYFKLLGFRVLHVQFSEKWDQEFYDRFADILIRYPMADLRRDFFTAILQKP